MQVVRELKRVFVDICIVLILLALYLTRFYEYLPAPAQLIFIKALLVSMGFMHAHITRKIAFSRVKWEEEGLNAKTVLVIAIYVVFIYAYSQGG